MIGDGMGLQEVKAASVFASGADGSLSFQSFPHVGTMTTSNADGEVTDSAASATAMATGVKVQNHVISRRLPGDDSPLATVLEEFCSHGFGGGVVTTTRVTHATPAAFLAHVNSRDDEQTISTQIVAAGPDVVFGGSGLSQSQAIAMGASFLSTRDEILTLAASSSPPRRAVASFTFDQDGHMPYEYDRISSGRTDVPTLSELSRAALRVLEQFSDGFFLMIEGGRIDHAGHANDVVRNVYETVEFSNAVAAVKSWADLRRLNDTTIIVTADHETGGMTFLSGGRGVVPSVSWTTGWHTGVDVGAWGWGEHGSFVVPHFDNTAIHSFAKQALNDS